MNLEDFDKLAVAEWLRKRVSQDDLLAGRVPNFTVTEGRVGRDAAFIASGRAELTIESLDAHACGSEAEFLDGEGEDALLAVRDGARIIVADASQLTPVTTSDVRTAVLGAAQQGVPALAAIVDPWRHGSEVLPPPTKSFPSRGVHEDRAVLVHPSQPGHYVVELTCDVVRQGPRSVVHLVVSVGRAGSARPSVTHVTLV